ncbi:unnamed protein product [Prorocentrum cordatum]|uniref:Uncharacterized protein n=1 Tax=Prorocentrum cordatum TaxID=2364126 RepID=A0ABN9T3M6_9DINO|nr:unnamed protein product [Polarella glacialis]
MKRFFVEALSVLQGALSEGGVRADGFWLDPGRTATTKTRWPLVAPLGALQKSPDEAAAWLGHTARSSSSWSSTADARLGLGPARPRPTGGEHTEERLAAELEAQRRLGQASANSMTVIYCREHGTNRVKRWLRGISIDSSYDFRRWRKHQEAFRHLNLWRPRAMVKSDNIRRLLFPDLALVGLLCLPLECFTITSVALGLLATFKTQTCYNRFISGGRNLWGQLINESRALGSRVLSRVGRPTGQDAQVLQSLQRGLHSEKAVVERAKQCALKLIRTFPVTLKYHLTEDGCNPHIEIGAHMPEAEVRAAVAVALRAELSLIWSSDSAEECAIVERIMSQEVANRPLQVLHELSFINGTVFSQPHLGGLDHPASTEVDRSLTTYHNVLGACEKILRTPVYTPYTKFTSRFLWLWCNSLPLALYPLLGPLCTAPGSLLISFFMLGIEDIGSRVEQPFDVMPLWQYCTTIEQSCVQLEKMHQMMAQPPLAEQPEEEQPGEEGADSGDEFDYDEDDPRLRSFADPL